MMKFDRMLETVATAFARVKPGGRRSDPKLAALDRGVLTVAFLLAALDGEIFPAEYAAFRELARKCRGGSERNVRALHDAAVQAAGPLMAMAQSGLYSEKDRLSAFLAAAARALPDGFSDGSLADLRRAFVLWVTIGVSDGDFSKLERTALESLAWHFAAVRVERGAKKGVSKSFRPLEMDFFEKAEKIVRSLGAPAKRAKAEEDLEALISNVQTADGNGIQVDRATCDFMFAQDSFDLDFR